VTSKVDIYQFLRGPLGQSVAVAQVVDLDVLDVIAILRVDFVRHGGGVVAPAGWRGRGLRRVS
jgi:hypothetical protein